MEKENGKIGSRIHKDVVYRSMVVEWAALKTAELIKKTDPERTASVAVLEYGLKAIYNASFVIILSLLIGLLSSNFQNMLIAIMSFVLVRFVSGGYHLKSSDYCVLVSTLFMCLVVFLPLGNTYFLETNLVTLLLMLIFAPSNIQSQINIGQKYNLMLKGIVVVLVLLNMFIIKNDIIANAFLIQSLTLFPFEKWTVKRK